MLEDRAVNLCGTDDIKLTSARAERRKKCLKPMLFAHMDYFYIHLPHY